MPPPVASLNEIVDPRHTAFAPDIAAGNGFTVTTVVMIHPVPNVYVMVAVLVTATTCPVITPVVSPAVATAVLLLLHVPPPGVSNKLEVKPEQTVFVPVIAAGNGFTVTIAVAAQIPKVYDIVVVPVPLPVTIPPAVIEAVVTSVLLHTPPPVASLSEVVSPRHTARVPDIAAGCVTTVTMVVAAHAPIVYDITVVPTPIPVTTPVTDTVPTTGVTLLHVPPPVASDKFMENVWHTGVVFPVIFTGCVFTVTTTVL